MLCVWPWPGKKLEQPLQKLTKLFFLNPTGKFFGHTFHWRKLRLKVLVFGLLVMLGQQGFGQSIPPAPSVSGSGSTITVTWCCANGNNLYFDLQERFNSGSWRGVASRGRTYSARNKARGTYQYRVKRTRIQFNFIGWRTRGLPLLLPTHR